MVEIIDGNLLTSDCDVIGHQSNCLSTMGGGIALQISLKWPEVAQVDRNFPLPAQERLGRVSWIRTQEGKYIVNMYGQYQHSSAERMTDYPALESAMIETLRLVKEWEQETGRTLKVGVPYLIGCGLAKGDWSVVLPIIEKVSLQWNHPIFLYRFQK